MRVYARDSLCVLNLCSRIPVDVIIYIHIHILNPPESHTMYTTSAGHLHTVIYEQITPRNVVLIFVVCRTVCVLFAVPASCILCEIRIDRVKCRRVGEVIKVEFLLFFSVDKESENNAK